MTLACEQAYLFGVSSKHLVGGGSAICEPARRMGPIPSPTRKSRLCRQDTRTKPQTSEPAQATMTQADLTRALKSKETFWSIGPSQGSQSDAMKGRSLLGFLLLADSAR